MLSTPMAAALTHQGNTSFWSDYSPNGFGTCKLQTTEKQLLTCHQCNFWYLCLIALSNQSQVSYAHENMLPIFSNSSSSLPVAGALSTKPHHAASLRYVLCSGYKADEHRNKANRDRFGVINCDNIRKLQITLKESPNKGHVFQWLKEKT